MKFLFYTVSLIIFFSGCSNKIPNLDKRLDTIYSLKDDKTFRKDIKTKNFDIFSLQNISMSCDNINIYIEGDGLSWITRTRISPDPTPINPLAFKLMNIDKNKCKVYLARPCQYIKSNECNNIYWTSHRFNEKVIESYLEIFDILKRENSNKTFNIIGYSGGGAVASIISAKRDDIDSLITIAGNLDHKKWTDYHNITPLSASLNPINFTDKLKYVKQYHLIGKNDRIVPEDIFLSYKSYFEYNQNLFYKKYNATHNKNWESIYMQFLENKTDF